MCFKHAEAITSSGKGPWYDWLESHEGQLTANIETLCCIPVDRGKFLENRLWIAYTAGMKAGFEQAKVEGVSRGAAFHAKHSFRRGMVSEM